MSDGLLIYLHVSVQDVQGEEKDMLFDLITRMKECLGSSHSTLGEWIFTGYASSDMIVDLSANSGVKTIDIVEKKS